MTDRRLVVYENDSGDPEFGNFMAVDPSGATGIPIPAFRPVTSLPPAGSLVGEGVFDKINSQSFIWDGKRWINIVPPSIISFIDEKTLLADTTSTVGTHAWAQSTGNLFVKIKSGAWRQIGLRVFDKEADLLAATAAEGEQAWAKDTDKRYVYISGAWVHNSIEFMTAVNATAAAPSPGRIIFSTDTEQVYFASGTSTWHVVDANVYSKTETYTKLEVDALLDSFAKGIEHDIAVKSIVDTLPSAPNEGDAYLLSATAASNANNVALYEGARWIFSAPTAGETHLVEDVSQLWHWNGSGWVLIATGTLASNLPKGDFFSVGSIQQSVFTEAQFNNTLPVSERTKWVLADGRDVAGTPYASITGGKAVPDLRGAYLRMAGTNTHGRSWSGGALKSFQSWLTGRPKTALTGITNRTGNHAHSGGSTITMQSDGGPHWPSGHDKGDTGYAGDHTHNVTINGGGDAETRPNTFAVNYFIKVA